MYQRTLRDFNDDENDWLCERLAVMPPDTVATLFLKEFPQFYEDTKLSHSQVASFIVQRLHAITENRQHEVHHKFIEKREQVRNSVDKFLSIFVGDGDYDYLRVLNEIGRNYQTLSLAQFLSIKKEVDKLQLEDAPDYQ